MAGYVRAYGKKALSWVLTFNCLLTILVAVGLLSVFYAAHWKLYQPYLLNANLLWAAILTPIMNLFPTANLGRVKVRRLRFHHFVYGLAILTASVMLIMFMPIPLMNLFKLYVRDVGFNVGRVFILVGLTLIIDDFGDVSNITMKALRFMKSKVYQNRRIIHVLQCLLFCITLYIFLCVTIWLTQNPKGINLPNLVIDGTTLVSSLTAFGSVDKKIWLRITSQPS
jgi:hypothetical protein